MPRLCLSLFLVLGLSACANTFSGVGKDVENAGEYIQDVFH
ncbi:MAG: entericidin A/B family lipoprotein [Pseudomonadota bacterium]